MFEFAATIDKKTVNNTWIITSSTSLNIGFSYPSDAIVSAPIQRETTDGTNINELVITPAGRDPTEVHFFSSYESFDTVKNIQIYGETNIKYSEFQDITIDGYPGLRRVDYYLYNDCSNETTIVEKKSVVYGSAIVQCPTHPQGYDKLRRDIVDSLSL